MKKSLAIGFIMFSFVTGWVVGNPCKAEEKFPTKPITVVVGFGPGGSADLPIRALAEAVSKTLGQPVVIINKPGATGGVALTEIKNTKPDGYTLSTMSAGVITSTLMRKSTFHPVNDFDAILQFHTLRFGLVVRPDSPFKSLKDLIAYAQANPNKVKYSTNAVGTPQHVVMMRLGDLLNIKWTHVPMDTGMEAISALLGGHVDCVAGAEWKPFVISDKLRLLVLFTDRRSESFPNVPTLIDLGYNLTALNTATLIGPKGIPKDRLKILYDAFYKATEDPGFRKVLETLDLVLDPKNSFESELIIKDIYETTGKWLEKIKE
jgi:tripartite-type tricarboxylate transporter receptor subunit TctC